eukprot:CAMPEP_0196130092 /NCGR_PEP_ID=MMETSP0910-20130528/578_1 /TAXON_ID=49265 /ORGANISM="Thalassiosira rotula, Strain GSO102" /LENGTH=138 /DNA_ID=CAMNT_0041389321 /DNA_START=268 /DNA_END=684 /DNA_ORIENTATION=-
MAPAAARVEMVVPTDMAPEVSSSSTAASIGALSSALPVEAVPSPVSGISSVANDIDIDIDPSSMWVTSFNGIDLSWSPCPASARSFCAKPRYLSSNDLCWVCVRLRVSLAALAEAAKRVARVTVTVEDFIMLVLFVVR